MNENVIQNNITNSYFLKNGEQSKNSYPPIKFHAFLNVSPNEEFVHLPNHPFSSAGFNALSFIKFLPSKCTIKTYTYSCICFVTNREIEYGSLTLMNGFCKAIIYKGWRAFENCNLFRHGSILRFKVSSLDETIMFAEVLKM
ncbi:hypothetical protein AHAS_Ahas03G0192300 [Arachis hypogaea]